MNYQEFENKVKSMTAHDIIMAMVDGLRQPRTKIDMDDFGCVEDGICYGCAATNTILHIMNANEEEAMYHILRRKYDASMPPALDKFEIAIDHLREGEVDLYNRYAKDCGIAQITPMPGQELPYLDDDYTEDQLQQYEKLAEYQTKNYSKMKKLLLILALIATAAVIAAVELERKGILTILIIGK